MKVLETDRLLLRHLSADDAEFILRLLNEPSFLQNVGDKGIRTLADARSYIADGPLTSYERFGFGLYLIELKGSGEAMGLCGLVKRDGLEDVDIGYSLLPKFWSQGYAVEAAAAVKDYAREAIGLNRIVAITVPDNQSSIRVLEKIGFRFEKMVRLSADDVELKLFATDL